MITGRVVKGNRFQTAAALMKINWPSGKWPIFKRVLQFKGMNI
jgi:hypothetical protein